LDGKSLEKINYFNVTGRLRQPPGVRAPRAPRFSALRSLKGGVG
jgi:hypothetical protein